MAYEYWKDTNGHYIIPPPELRPLYGAWVEESPHHNATWFRRRDNMPATSSDPRVIAAMIVSNPDYSAARVREIGPDGLPVEEVDAAESEGSQLEKLVRAMPDHASLVFLGGKWHVESRRGSWLAATPEEALIRSTTVEPDYHTFGSAVTP